MFENMPVAAAVTLLSKLQSDVRYAEGEVLHSLVANVGLKDLRVNKLQAFVVPSQTRLYPGETMTAQMFMAAVDSTQQPQVYVNGQLIQGNQVTVKAGAPGKHTLSGYMLMKVDHNLSNTLILVVCKRHLLSMEWRQLQLI